MSCQLVRLSSFAAAASFILMTSAANAADPVVVQYELLSLAAPAQFEYRYTIANAALVAPLSWFSIDFPTALYDEASLVIPAGTPGSWSAQILGSVLDNPAQYDAFKQSGPGLAIGTSQGGFAVRFGWLGTGLPGSQAFTIYDPSTFSVITTGLTVPVLVPEPTTSLLMLLGSLAVAYSVKSARISPRHPGRG